MSRLSLLVMSESGVFSFAVPSKGEITIGRSERCDVAIDDPQLSREHASIRTGATVEVTDLGSVNGTRLGELSLTPHEPKTMTVGDTLAVGASIVILQSSAARARRRHLWSHGYFEARLEDECARGEATGRPFAVLRVRIAHVAAQSAPGVLENTISEHLRSVDVVGTYAPSEYELLLVETDRAMALAIADRIRVALGNVTTAKIHLGVASYPTDGRTPEELVERAAPPREIVAGDTRSSRRIVESGALERLRPIVARVAAGTIPVLLLGETGVGKDVLAGMVHALSPRRDAPMVSLNCAAIPENLLESELFGYERGAFTGAAQAKSGLLETAEGGTVFLDEVGDMPLAVQAKLLRVLDQREVMRVGGLKPRHVDVRFVAATHRDLEAEVARGAFREDLFYRLNAVTIVVPPLRDRPAEIVALARVFAVEAARALGRDDSPELTQDAAQLLITYAWPGNVRELRNVIERAVLLSADGRVDREHLPLEKMGRTLSMRPPVRASRVVFEPDRDGAEATTAVTSIAISAATQKSTPGSDEDRARVKEALVCCDGNQTNAARQLGISRRTLVSRIELYGLPRPRKKI